MPRSGLNSKKKEASGRNCSVIRTISEQACAGLTGLRGGLSVTLDTVPSSFALRFSSLLRRYIIGVQLIMGGGIDPSPTRDLKVSGSRLGMSYRPADL
jgi:hypothetical protein